MVLHNTSSKDEPDEVEKLVKWQEERIQKKLRGEYESALVHLSEIIHDNLDAPLTVSAVRVEGPVKTRTGFLGGITKPLIPKGSTTLEDVLHSARAISDRLQQTDVFYPPPLLSTRIERASSPSAPASAVDIVVRAKERPNFSIAAGTQVANNAEGTASLTVRHRNLFGGAEVLEADLAMGATTRRAFHVGLSKPLSADLRTRGQIGVFSTERDVRSWASCVEGLIGAKASLSRGSNELAYQLVHRNVGQLTENASIAIREAAGLSTKSSLTHTYLLDTRDDTLAATRGFYLKFMQELAGGQTQFYKTELEGQVSRKLFSGLSASLALRSGLLLPFQSHTFFSDRFHLGGPTTLRGFKPSGLGPHSPPITFPGGSSSDALGGTAYYALGLSLTSDIPKKAHWPVKLHGWVNAGRLDNVDPRKDMQGVRDMFSKPSISAGVGMIYRLDPIRIELNFGVPLVVSKSDLSRRGIQVGMGIEFL